jgi:hypothetical protein
MRRRGIPEAKDMDSQVPKEIHLRRRRGRGPGEEEFLRPRKCMPEEKERNT